MCESAADFSLSYFVFDHPTPRRGLRVEAGSCPRYWTRVLWRRRKKKWRWRMRRKKEEEEEEGRSSNQGQLWCLSWTVDRVLEWGVEGDRRRSMRRWNTQRTVVTYAIVNMKPEWITAQSGYIRAAQQSNTHVTVHHTLLGFSFPLKLEIILKIYI